MSLNTAAVAEGPVVSGFYEIQISTVRERESARFSRRGIGQSCTLPWEMLVIIYIRSRDRRKTWQPVISDVLLIPTTSKLHAIQRGTVRGSELYRKAQ